MEKLTDNLKKVILAGIGAVATTAEKSKDVLDDMVKKGEVDVTSRYESLNKNNIIGDFKFVLSEKYLSNDSDLTFFEKIIMN